MRHESCFNRKPNNFFCVCYRISIGCTRSSCDVVQVINTELKSITPPDIVVPVTVTYIADNNEEGSGTGTVTVPVDVVMYLPEPSIIPYRIEAAVSAVSPEGQYSQTQVIDGVTYYIFVINCCVTAILKVTMDVELIVPSYGYAVIPPCQEYTEEVCSGYFELPLYPGSRNGTGGTGN